MENEEIDLLVSYVISNQMLKKTKNGLLLTQEEIDLLKKYDINIEDYGSMDELLMDIDDILSVDSDLEELEYLLTQLEERKYYEQVNK